MVASLIDKIGFNMVQISAIVLLTFALLFVGTGALDFLCVFCVQAAAPLALLVFVCLILTGLHYIVKPLVNGGNLTLQQF